MTTIRERCIDYVVRIKLKYNKSTYFSYHLGKLKPFHHCFPSFRAILLRGFFSRTFFKCISFCFILRKVFVIKVVQ